MFNIFNRGKIRFHDPKSYFLHKMGEVQYMIWDLDFKRFKTLELREEMRKMYDDLANKISITLNTIKAQLKNPKAFCSKHDAEKGIIKDVKAKCSCVYVDNHMEVGEIERLYDQMVLQPQQQEQYLAQIKEFDLQVQGCVPNAEHQEGVRGINQEIDALIELTAMLKAYIKSV